MEVEYDVPMFGNRDSSYCDKGSPHEGFLPEEGESPPKRRVGGQDGRDWVEG